MHREALLVKRTVYVTPYKGEEVKLQKLILA